MFWGGGGVGLGLCTLHGQRVNLDTCPIMSGNTELIKEICSHITEISTQIIFVRQLPFYTAYLGFPRMHIVLNPITRAA